MADSTVNRFVGSVADAAARAAFTPVPPTPASGPAQGYTLYQRDTDTLYSWDSGSAAWVQISGGGANAVTAAGTLTSGQPVLGGGSKAVAVGPINLAGGSSFVTGTLPVANGGTGVAANLGVILTSTLTLSNAQILASPTTEYDAIPALGAGFAPMYLFSIWKLDSTAAAYATVNAAAYAVIGTTGEAIALSSYFQNNAGLSLTSMTDFLTNTAKMSAMVPFYAQDGGIGGLAVQGGVSYAALDNTSIKLIVSNGGSGNFTGGNAANSWVLTTYYVRVAV